LEDVLQGKGYGVVTAQNGMEAITKVYHSPPSLILSDVMMPELNGYHLCRLLKNDPCTAHIPIILLTNLKERHDRFWGEKAGANLYIEKARDLTPIIEAVESLLARTPGPQASPLPSPPELSSADIRSRVTGILDRLLYESTISNEVLKLTGLTHDVDQLAREFLQFLSVICHYSIACLLLHDGRDKHVLCIQTVEAVDAEQIEKAKRQTLEAAGLSPQQQNPVRLLQLSVEETKPPESGKLHLLQSLPILDQEERIATLMLFSTQNKRVSEGTRHALHVVAERLLIVARYLKKIKEIEEVKSDFVSMLVHDMRSPLTSIRGFTDVLADGVLGTVNEEQASAFKNIQGGCDQLLMLIEDVLDLSKLEAGKMQVYPGPLSIQALAEKTGKNLSALVAEKNLTLHLDLPKDCPWVLADGKQLARVMTNLLTNAVKFTPTGGLITISAQPALKHATHLQINVADTGPGIPPELQQKLFARYQQLPAARTFGKGTGLGLAICKEIVLLHGGEIWVDSPLSTEGGSRFSFTLPMDE
jgi:signal transduction histidine kinase/CheY-like chemotaxis protein